MEKIDTATPDLTMENEAKLLDLFPQVATEVIGEDGEVLRAVDFDALRELLGNVAESQRERYQFTWPGKRAAKEEVRKPINKTLRPCPEKSVDWDTTENLYIEGDNLEALKLLRETYAGKVKLIYIDPPYNTGNDFIYDDDYAMTHAEYVLESGEYDAEGGRLVANTESNGRFHSDWCSMMYPRLLLAKDLLASDGIMLVSVKTQENGNLEKILEEIFGKSGVLGCLTWESTTQPVNAGQAKFSLQQKCEFIYLVTKERSSFCLEQSRKGNNYPHIGKFGPCRFEIIEKSDAGIDNRETMKFKILGQEPRPGKRWQIGENTARELEKAGKVEIVDGIVKKAVYPEDEADLASVKPFWSHFSASDYGTAQSGKRELNELFGAATGFDTVKSVPLIAELIKKVENDALIVDFFSGSATTAHAVMKLNCEDGGRRSFIAVQYPESCKDNAAAQAAGISTISELRRKRIELAAEALSKNFNKTFDGGFRVLCIDSSNFNDVSAAPDQYEQASIDLFVDNLKPDRTDLDILFQVLPKFRIPLSAKIEELDINGKAVFNVNDGQLVACFSSQIDNETIERIAQMRPLYAVFRDACLADDATAANLEELFKTFSPDTVRRVI